MRINGAPIQGHLQDPMIELYDQDGQLIASNDDWRTGLQEAEIQSSGFAPGDERESVILRTVTPGRYTAIVRGKSNTSGIGLVEVYDRDGGDTQMANLSTRGFVQTDDNVMIGGFIAGNQSGNTKVVVRAIGPSLQGRVPNPLADPMLELRNANGGLIRANDDWKESQRTEIEKTGLAPTHDAESAMVETLAPGNYTGIVRGKFETVGIALVEMYNVQ